MGLITRIAYSVGRVVGGVLKLANLVTGIPAGESTQNRRSDDRRGERGQQRR
ncbi:hypothetical protein GCM10017786_33690 [Amycolatopsis deserti]|uniref:Uncharacterized protein n=1 Tax=Amycolatopsis deserti TaxID=185696 RepID=A0ABQ3IYV0_9PSEU|nr:hypothetical protein [Amycolatopsis deserti]GHE98071.1 hypothetical protein GCM10017786_33690 [Amycolatopsis deserti]